MSDETVSPTSELALMVKGVNQVVSFTDNSGKKYTVQPLDLEDLCEYEARVGTSLLLLDFGKLNLKDIVYLVYLSLRKEGISPADIDAKKFLLTEKDMKRNFNLALFGKSGQLLQDILRISGLEAETVNPQKANQ